MSLMLNFQLMADYNQWMNDKIYETVASLTAEDLSEDRGAFFGSILGTLNHILVGDTIWLKRFAQHPSQFSSLKNLGSVPNPEALSEILFSDISELRGAREKMDEIIVNFVHEVSDSDYEYQLPYRNTEGKSSQRKFGFLVHHFFNHQTHHRGQLTVLLSQMGLDVGSTDLLFKIPTQG